MTLSVFNSIDSTNSKLWQLIDDGLKAPSNLIHQTTQGAIALAQTAGRGQWGHSWISSRGGLYLSAALNLDLPLSKSPHLVMATAWGIAKALRYYQLPVTIKWSNDLILNQRKLGGIKIETRHQQNRITQAVVGVGINWCNPVPDLGINLQSYYQSQPSSVDISSLEELTAITAYGILLGYQYYKEAGIDKLLTEYLAILNSLGKEVTVGNCLGEVTGVTSSGKLKVKLKSSGAAAEIAIAPGQISLGY